MNPYLPFGLMIVAILAQVTVLSKLNIAGAHPDLILLMAISWSLLRGANEGIVWGFIGGLALDLYSAAPFGVFTISLMLACYASGVGESALFRHNLILPMLAVAMSSLLYHGVALVLLQTFDWPVRWGSHLIDIVLPATLLNTVLMPIIYVVMRAVHRSVGHREMTW